MVDKSPKFLQSTPGFPRELKMGIFAASEKGKFLEAANCDNSYREREGLCSLRLGTL